MSHKHLVLVAAILGAGVFCLHAQAGDLRISLPKRNKPTPVQQLNREGVEALRKNQFEKARALFYKAYLYDPDDPFTLNNLGYISELQGEVERAHSFYALASNNATEAVIDQASVRKVEGKTVAEVASRVQDASMQVNRDNVEAIRLISQGRAPEAELLLQDTLRLQPGNPFTLNNYAVAKEMEGDYPEALKYYTAAAATRSSEPVIVTVNREWRGKPVDEMAADAAKKLRDRLQATETLEAKVARLNLHGVSALNRNAFYDARRDFEQAYKLDPENAFSLNNRGYVAEMDGDTESAQFFYEKARQAGNANIRVGYSTQRGSEGKKLFEVADDNDQKMDKKMAQVVDAKRKSSGSIELKRRDGTTVSQPPATAPDSTTPHQELGPPQPPIPQLNPATNQSQSQDPNKP